ncbi:hypothetical protein AS132_01045 [Photobacterium sanguinicancri]|nr:hypothetical protein AS132_01045 [Photobacterium sanguinicancri]
MNTYWTRHRGLHQTMKQVSTQKATCEVIEGENEKLMTYFDDTMLAHLCPDGFQRSQVSAITF